MKAFKKLMAAALVCVMALTVLTGCAVGDNIAEKKLVDKLNDTNNIYSHKSDLDDEAEKAWKDNGKTAGTGTIVIGDVTYNYVIVKKPSGANKKDNWGDEAKTIDNALKDTSKKNSNNKIEIGVKICSDNGDYAAVVAKAK